MQRIFPPCSCGLRELWALRGEGNIAYLQVLVCIPRQPRRHSQRRLLGPICITLSIVSGGGKQLHLPAAESGDGDWTDVDDSLLNRKALQEYILCAGQHPAGGLRDKPPK